MLEIWSESKVVEHFYCSDLEGDQIRIHDIEGDQIFRENIWVMA